MELVIIALIAVEVTIVSIYQSLLGLSRDINDCLIGPHSWWSRALAHDGWKGIRRRALCIILDCLSSASQLSLTYIIYHHFHRYKRLPWKISECRNAIRNIRTKLRIRDDRELSGETGIEQVGHHPEGNQTIVLFWISSSTHLPNTVVPLTLRSIIIDADIQKPKVQRFWLLTCVIVRRPVQSVSGIGSDGFNLLPENKHS